MGNDHGPGNQDSDAGEFEDAVEAEATFSMLMGDRVEPRREFIQENARAVRNLDV